MDSADTYRPHARERSISRRRRSRSPRRRRSYTRSRSRSRGGYRRIDRRSRSPLSSRLPSRSYEDRAAAKEQMMQTIRDSSQQDRRVYIGNLSYDVKWHHLKDFMRQAGEVLFADVLLLPNGMSKGCGIVEYATRDQAQHAVNTLSNQNLMGRLVYVREDREPEPRFSQPASGARGNYDSGLGRGGQGGGTVGGNYGGSLSGGRQLYISNLPYNVGWQDLKDLFRQAAHTGSVFRADVHVAHDGRAKGSGVVAFETAEDARNAISQFNGYEWQGRVLEVREDRFAGFGGGTSRGGYGGFGGRGGYGGRSFGGRGGPGSTYSSRSNLGGGYNSHGGTYDANAADMPSNSFTDSATGGGDRGPIIYVRNLPWSTSNDDLVELFTTIGKVERAEIQYELNGRSRGTGVVEFDNVENADTAIAKFTGYQYGGRPLGLSYVKYTDAGDEDSMDVQKPDELAQDHVM